MKTEASFPRQRGHGPKPQKGVGEMDPSKRKRKLMALVGLILFFVVVLLMEIGPRFNPM